ncbi:hypothetical protein FE249_18870 (plasmid) [Acidiphilium multivorum]|uniref:hypothetical protein n=1 Tax=Acidiphilium multivorum TaxID=62140 RepID=UPI001F4C50A5|nr:hypothetical protein [Acidiphilium multivorum]UNC16277.1 hypothetical protein FE249_18870 [Acidiphilium multivorum]
MAAESAVLTPAEASTSLAALSQRLAGKFVMSQPSEEAARKAVDTLQSAAPGSSWIAFSRQELKLLWLAITNGAPEYGNTLGMTPREMRMFRRSANRIGRAASEEVLF